MAQDEDTYFAVCPLLPDLPTGETRTSGFSGTVGTLASAKGVLGFDFNGLH